MLASLAGPRIRPAKLCAVKSACCARIPALNQAFFRERNAAAVADDEVIQQADLDQGESVAQARRDDLVRLAGLRDAARVVVGDN
jgi:hypothetical protein